MRCGGGAPCTPATWLLPVLLAGAWLCAVGVAVLAWVEVRAGVEELYETALGKLVKTERLKLRVGHDGERLASTTPTWARDGDTERPSAHLTRQLSRLAWSDGGAGGGVAASLRGGMRYHNGSLTVPRAGSYFVFSQVQLYHVACGRVRESAHVEVVHSVRVTSTTDTTTATTATTTATTIDTTMATTTATTATTATTTDSSSGGGAATVMSTTWAPCASAGSARPTWFQSSHLGGVLHLQAGSSVAVHVTHADLVGDKREWNFFGAFLL
ncbi:unnamed protein product [Lampetra fluviatilis]